MKQDNSIVRSAVRVAVGVAVVLCLALLGMLTVEGWDWSLFDFVLVGVLLTIIGVTLELAVRRAGNLVIASGIAALGVAAGIVGEADDAPGLVLIGMLLIGSALVLGVRATRRTDGAAR